MELDFGTFEGDSFKAVLHKPANHKNLRWTPHPVVVTIRDSRDYIRVLLYSYYTTITGWGVLLIKTRNPSRGLEGGRPDDQRSTEALQLVFDAL